MHLQTNSRAVDAQHRAHRGMRRSLAAIKKRQRWLLACGCGTIQPLGDSQMADVSNLEAEERALVALARQTMVVYALTHNERSFKLAHDALQRAELLRREAYLRQKA
jgi:hypothetical protein